MARKDGDAVKKAIADGVGSRKGETHGVLIYLLHLDRLVIDYQQVALRGTGLFVKIDLEGEEDVIGVERRAIREPHSATKLKSECLAVRRRRPGFRQRRHGLLRVAIDVDQVGGHATDDVARSLIERGDRVERLWLGGERGDQAATGAAGGSCHAQEVFLGKSR